MDIKFWNQPKDINLGDILNEKLKKGFKNVWIIAGVAKDTGLEMLCDSIEEARKLGTNVNLFIGIDRKNISKDMLLKLLNFGCKLYLHINRDDNKVETRMYIFESKDSDSLIYSSSGKLSEGGLFTSNLVVQEISYLASEKKAFEKDKSIILESNKMFKETDEEELQLLAEKGEVVARITERKIPSISEMYGGTTLDAIGNDLYDESSSSGLFDIHKNDFDIDVDVDFSGEVKKAELSVEAEAKKEKAEKENIEKLASEKLAKFYNSSDDSDKEKKVSIIKDIDNINFANTNMFVFELNKIAEKGVNEGEIKIPIYLYENMKSFFEADRFEQIVDNKGKVRFGSNVKCEIIDTVNNTRKDDTVCIYVEDRYLAIKSQLLSELKLEEKDIMRIIKDSDSRFCMEIIRKDSKEYNIWENVCIYTMKNTKRKFGIM